VCLDTHERHTRWDKALLVLTTLLFLIVWISDHYFYLYCVPNFHWSSNLTTLYSLLNCGINLCAWVYFMLSTTNKLLAKLFTCVLIIILVYWCYFVPETLVSNHYCWCYTHLLWLFTLSISHNISVPRVRYKVLIFCISSDNVCKWIQPRHLWSFTFDSTSRPNESELSSSQKKGRFGKTMHRGNQQ